METLIDSRLPVHRALYFGGAWRESSSGRFIDVKCPSTGQSLGRVPDADAEDVARAVTSARAGFEVWRDVPPAERARAVRAAATVIREHARELAWLDAVDCGVAYQAMLHDAMVSADYMDYFAGLATELKGSTIPVGPGWLNYTCH
jgi:betaine-aldehyde dehydrogenase